MNTSSSLGSAAEFGTFYSANATGFGRMSATSDVIATALATKLLKMTTTAMNNQFSQYNRVFSSFA